VNEHLLSAHREIVNVQLPPAHPEPVEGWAGRSLDFERTSLYYENLPVILNWMINGRYK
jgi:hypothetical protein